MSLSGAVEASESAAATSPHVEAQPTSGVEVALTLTTTQGITYYT